MVINLMISAKMATLDVVKTMVFWSKSYDVIIHVHYVTKKNLSRDLNYIVDVVMWTKFCNRSISMTEVIITLIL